MKQTLTVNLVDGQQIRAMQIRIEVLDGVQGMTVIQSEAEAGFYGMGLIAGIVYMQEDESAST